jgi:beta-lactamase class A
MLLLTTVFTAAQSPLETKLRSLIAASGAEVAVAMRTLDGKAEVLIDPDKPFHAASTMKVPVMIELFRQAKAGTVSLAERLVVRNEFRSIVDGSTYKLSEGDDSDSAIYAALGKSLTLEQLNEAMITVSSNFATNLLIERLDVAKIRATVKRLGAEGMQVLRGVEDQKAFDKGLNNATTAKALMVLLEKIARGEAVSRAASRGMADILRMQQFNDGIPAGVPAGVPVGHKTGSITRISHDAAIVYAEQPYVLVVLTRGIEDGKKSSALIAAISKVIYATRR